jgi:NitT/TauT family transport system substrate-binding protein
MSSRCRPVTVTTLVVAVLAIAACGGSDGDSSDTATATSGGAAQKTDTITAAINPASSTVAFKVADERGIFKKHGITIKYGTAAPTGAAQIAQILSGDIDVGAGAYTAGISAVAKGLPVVITNALDQDYDRDGATGFAAIVPKNSKITSFKQLEGKNVAVNSLQGNWDVSIREAVAQDGGDPSKVKLVAVPFPSQVTALKSARVDAISTLQPFAAQLLADGFKSLGDPQAIGFGGKTDSVSTVMFMSKKYTAEHPDAVKAFVAAMDEANEWCNAHPDEVRKELASFAKLPLETVNQMPLPQYTTKLGATQTDDWSKLLVKYKILDEAPAADQVQWSGAPLQ